MALGPTFGKEIIAAGLGGLPFTWGSDGAIEGRANLTTQQNATLDSVIAAHNPAAVLAKMIPLSVLQARFELEGQWDTYVNYMFGAAGRRNAFLRIMFIGQPVDAANGGLRTTMTAAGLTTAQIDRILA